MRRIQADPRTQLRCIISVHSVAAFCLHIKLSPASTSQLHSKMHDFAWSVMIITLQPRDCFTEVTDENVHGVPATLWQWGTLAMLGYEAKKWESASTFEVRQTK